MANGFDVSDFVSRILALSTSISASQSAIVPRPPASLTAAAIRGPAAAPTGAMIGASMMGTSMPSRSQSGVLMDRFLP